MSQGLRKGGSRNSEIERFNIHTSNPSSSSSRHFRSVRRIRCADRGGHGLTISTSVGCGDGFGDDVGSFGWAEVEKF